MRFRHAWALTAVVVVASMSATPTMQGGSATPPARGAAAGPLLPKLAGYKKEVATTVDGSTTSPSRWSIRCSASASSAFRSSRRSATSPASSRRKASRFSEASPASRRRGRRVGIGEAGHRARVRHRLHPAGVAKAGRRLSRPDHRGCTRARRRAQLGRAAQYHRGHRGEADHEREKNCQARSCSGRVSPRNCSRQRLTYVRAGVFKDVDVVLYNHVGTNLSTAWGDSAGNGLVSVDTPSRANRLTAVRHPGAGEEPWTRWS